MSKGKIKLQPIAVRSPLPQGVSIPVLPLPHQELITGRDTQSNDMASAIGITDYTGSTDSPDRQGNNSSAGRIVNPEKSNTGQVRVAFPELPSYIEGKARGVWKFLAEKAVFDDQQESGKGLFVRATRREIAKGAGIGSLDTVDRSLARLQGLGFIDVERSRGVNEGSIIQIKSPEQHPQSEEKAWQKIANVLEQSANLMRKQGRNLSPNQLIQWSQLADRAFRLVSTTKNRESE